MSLTANQSGDLMLFSPQHPIDLSNFQSVICFHKENFHETSTLRLGFCRPNQLIQSDPSESHMPN